MSANDRQVGGVHYKSKGMQHWDFVAALKMTYLSAQISRYVCRWRNKNGVEDLEKSLHYMDKMIELEKIRRSHHLDIMCEFINDNRLQEHERIVVNMLVNYELGDEDRLHEAKLAIRELIGIVTGEVKPEDPKFIDTRDEWRNK